MKGGGGGAYWACAVPEPKPAARTIATATGALPLAVNPDRISYALLPIFAGNFSARDPKDRGEGVEGDNLKLVYRCGFATLCSMELSDLGQREVPDRILLTATHL